MEIPKTIVYCLLAFVAFSCTEPLPPTWETQDSGTNEKLLAIEFANEDIGYAVGGIRYTQDRLLTTKDGGDTWRVHPTIFGQTLFDIHVVDENRAFASGIGGKILKTEDGGDNWKVFQLKYWEPLRAITSFDSLVVVVGGGGYNQGVIARSENFGKTWEVVDTFAYEFRDVVFTSATQGFASGYGVIFETQDAGKTWNFTEAEGEFFASLCFPTAQTGYAAGRTGSILKTTDGGVTWKFQRNGSSITRGNYFYNQIAFSDESHGYVVGDKGIVMETTDGGKTWNRWNREEKNDYYGISLLPGGGYIAGEAGKIIRFHK